MFDQASIRKEENDVEDEVGSNYGHSFGFSPPVEADITKSILNRSRRRAFSSTSSSKLSLSVCSRPRGIGLRRAFLIGRRGSPSTPAPSWKVSDNSNLDAPFEHHHRHLKHDHTVQGLHISARKLAAALWELQKVPFSIATRIEEDLAQESQDMNDNPTKQPSNLQGQPLSPASSRISKGSQTKPPVYMKFGDSGKTHGRLERRKGQQVMPVTATSKKEIIGDGRTTSPSKTMVLGSKDALCNLGCGPTTTSELLKVLNHVWSLEEQHASTMSLVGALRIELEDARSQLQELLLNEKSHHKEVENISKRVAEERALWQDQQEQTIRMSVQSVRQELENEKKSKQKLEMLHKKAAREFRDAKKTVVRALEDLERERKARQLMEEVCDELAREIGQDKTRVEELKRESVKVREEVEEERKMLQMAEVWREERVQMKLMEAKLELEEKNTALDKLRSQLEAFLETKRAGELKDRQDHAASDTRQEVGRRSMEIVVGRNLLDPFRLREQRVSNSGRNSVDSGRGNGLKQGAWTSDSDDDDDLHSIELNQETLAKTATSKWGLHSFQQYHERGFSDENMLTGNKLESEGIKRSRNDQREKKERHEVKAEDVTPVSVPQGFQWIGHNVEGSEKTEWRQEQQGGLHQGRGESSKSWQSCTEDSQSQVSFSPNALSRSIMRAAGGSPNLFHEQTSRSGEWQQQISNHRRHQPNLTVSLANHGSIRVSSPTRKWNNHMPSPNFRSRLSTEASSGSSLKTRLLEAKLEGQQALQKGSQNF